MIKQPRTFDIEDKELFPTVLEYPMCDVGEPRFNFVEKINTKAMHISYRFVCKDGTEFINDIDSAMKHELSINARARYKQETPKAYQIVHASDGTTFEQEWDYVSMKFGCRANFKSENAVELAFDYEEAQYYRALESKKIEAMRDSLKLSGVDVDYETARKIMWRYYLCPASGGSLPLYLYPNDL